VQRGEANGVGSLSEIDPHSVTKHEILAKLRAGASIWNEWYNSWIEATDWSILDLSGADLRGVDLRDAHLKRVILRGGKNSSEPTSAALISQGQILPKRISVRAAYCILAAPLAGKPANLSKVYLSGAAAAGAELPR